MCIVSYSSEFHPILFTHQQSPQDPPTTTQPASCVFPQLTSGSLTPPDQGRIHLLFLFQPWLDLLNFNFITIW